MSNYRAYFHEPGSMGHLKHVLNTVKYGAPGFRDEAETERIAEDVQTKLLGTKHPDTNAMVHEMSGLWQRLVRQDEAGWDRVTSQGEYFEDVLKEMGMDLNTGHIKYGWDGKELFEKALSESVKVADPEKAALHFDTVSDPVYTGPGTVERAGLFSSLFKRGAAGDGKPEKSGPAGYDALVDACGLAYDEGYFRNESAVEGICKRAQSELLDKAHKDPSAMAHTMAGLWGDLQDQFMTGKNGMREQGRYFKGIADELGLDLNIAGTKRDFSGRAHEGMGRRDRDRTLEEAICGNMTVSDPEKAKEHFKEVSEPHYEPKPSALDKLKGFLSKDEADGRAPGEPGIEAGDDAGPVY